MIFKHTRLNYHSITLNKMHHTMSLPLKSLHFYSLFIFSFAKFQNVLALNRQERISVQIRKDGRREKQTPRS